MTNATVRANARTSPNAISHLDPDLVCLSIKLSACDALLCACTEENEEGLQNLLDEHHSLLAKINRVSARTVADLKVKVAAAELALKWDDDASSECEGSFVELCKSVNKDLLALAIRRSRGSPPISRQSLTERNGADHPLRRPAAARGAKTCRGSGG
jgi:hypothetical protein